MVDIFARLEKNAGGPIGQYMSYAHGYYAFPKLEGDIGPHMVFRGKKMLNWSLNNYLGLANHPEVRKADAEGAAQFGMAAPMGARMMSGQTVYHERLERELAAFVGKEDAFLLNFGYQGMISIIDCLLTPRDVVVYDAEAHACIIDGLRLHKGKRFVFGHNDMESLRLQLQHATDLAEEQNGGMMMLLILTTVLGYELKTAVGTSVFIMTFTALTGAISHFAIGGMPDITVLILCVVFTLIWARIAAVLANKAQPKTLNRATGVVLVVLGIVVFVFSLIK